jgi:hypothetical protein
LASKVHVSVLLFATHRICVFSGASSVLSFTTHHHVCFTSTSSVHQSHLIIICVSRRHVPPCYQCISSCCVTQRHVLRAINPLIIMFAMFHEKHVPPCYQSQLIINLCFHERGTSLRAINHNSSSFVFSRKARPPCYQSNSS